MTSYFSNLFSKTELTNNEVSEGETSDEENSIDDVSEGETSDEENSIDEVSEGETSEGETSDEENSIDEVSESEITLAEEQNNTFNEKIDIIEYKKKERNIYKEFQCYSSKKFLDEAKPYFESPSFSFSKMMFLNGLKSKTEKDSIKEWIAAYRIQMWWKKNKKKIEIKTI